MDKKLILLFAFCQALLANAQEYVINDSLRLQEITITGTRLKEFTSGHRIETVDSVSIADYRSGGIAELLRKSGSLYVQSYGPSGLSTVSFRGLNANHAAIVWNGFNLQSIMNGQLDMNLLPVYLLDDIRLQHGGSGALFGSGAVGGAIHLGNSPAFNKGFRISSFLGAGSFGQWQLGNVISISNEKLISTSKLFIQRAENDFTFRNFAKINSPKERFAHAAFDQVNFVQQNQYRLSQKDLLDFNLWLQETHRQIPASITARLGRALQDDHVLRASAEFRHSSRHTSFFARSGFFTQQILFKDPDIAIDATNRAHTSISEIELRHKLSPVLTVNSGLQFEYSAAETDNYPDNLDQTRFAAFGSAKYSHPYHHFYAIASLRYSVVEWKTLPLIPSLAIEKGFGEHVVLKGNIGRNYRLPTFNDLYWVPYGNPNLVPESGWSQEITCETDLPGMGTLFSATLYNSTVRDLIKWLPDEKGIFRPRNISRVWARGIETVVSTTVRANDLEWEWKGRYSHTLSTQRPEDNSKGKGIDRQLMYIPRHTASASIKIAKKHVSLNYLHQLTGKRYTTSDNDPGTALPLHHTGDFSAGMKFGFYKSECSLQGRILNIWNETYESLAYYPMPGRNYHISLNIAF